MSLTTREGVNLLSSTSPTPLQTTAHERPTDPSPSLPEQPVVIIEARPTWSALDFKELWRYRELLFFLVWRDVKVRYKQALFGVAWAVLQPLFLMLIFTVFYGRLAGVTTGSVPYPLFAYAGLVLWTFFANAVTISANSVVANANVITKVYFPRILVPAASVGACLVDFVLAFLPLVGLMVYYSVKPTWQWLLLPAYVLLVTLFALGVGTWLSALNVKYRDIRFALTFMVQIWLFVSSVILPSSAVPEKWRWMLKLNPMSTFIEGWREALFGYSVNGSVLAIAVGITFAVLILAAFDFRRMEKRFADVI